MGGMTTLGSTASLLYTAKRSLKTKKDIETNQSDFMKQQMVFTLSNFHEDLHGFCLAHPSLLVIQALQRPI